MRKLLYLMFLICLISACSEPISRMRFIHIPSGNFFFGTAKGMDNETPAVLCKVEAFRLSKTEISNEIFEVFVEKTGYVTDAEKTGGMVFDGEWKLVKTAHWRMPEGKEVDREKWRKLPVVQVSYADAMAYCKWAKCRLPSEIEWEYASKLGKSNSVKMNITSAKTPHPVLEEVQSSDANELGIQHQSGNVWEWCLDSYNSERHDKLALMSTTESRPPFLGRSYDPEKMNSTDKLRVIKGGSFLCQAGHCAGYRPEARQSAEQHQGYFHIGFRVAKDL